MVTAAWSCGYVNVNSVPGKLVKFADDTACIGPGDGWRLKNSLCESLGQSADSVLAGGSRKGGKGISTLSTEGEKSDWRAAMLLNGLLQNQLQFFLGSVY